MKISDCKIIELPKILDDRGNLSFIEGGTHIPFEINRTYWVYDVPGGQKRGGHSFKTQQEVLIALSGSFDIVLNDGENEKTISLNRSYNGVYIPAGIWRHLENFSTNSLCLVIASTDYDSNDYERVFEDFKERKNA